MHGLMFTVPTWSESIQVQLCAPKSLFTPSSVFFLIITRHLDHTKCFQWDFKIVTLINFILK